jgi:membrane protein implicated in regulation of membrane protease activity
MTWADFYLICFLLGLALSLLSVLTGSAHLHLPHIHVPHVHVPHVDLPHIHVPHIDAPHAEAEGIPWLNFGTMTAFLAWFGGTGYLLERYYAVWFLVALAIALLSGLGGAAIVFWFLAKLAGDEQALDPADYDMVGVLGKLSNPIREGGTGEIIFSQEGVRRVSGARSYDGTAIPKGAEVVVQRYEKGIAYVRRLEDMEQESEIGSQESGVRSQESGDRS